MRNKTLLLAMMLFTVPILNCDDGSRKTPESQYTLVSTETVQDADLIPGGIGVDSTKIKTDKHVFFCTFAVSVTIGEKVKVLRENGSDQLYLQFEDSNDLHHVL